MLTMTRTSPTGETSPVLEGDHVEVLVSTDEGKDYRAGRVLGTWYEPDHVFGRCWAVEVDTGDDSVIVYVDFNGRGRDGRHGQQVLRPVVQPD